MIFWIIFLIFNLQNCYMIAVMTMCLKKRFLNASVWKYILAFEIGSVIPAYLRFTLPFNSIPFTIVYNWMTIFLVGFIAFAFKDYIWKKALWLFTYLCVATLAELICAYVLEILFGIQLRGTWNCNEDLIYMIVSNLILFMFTIIPIMLWKKAQISIRGKGKVILPLIIMPISQITMLDFALFAFYRYGLIISEVVYWILGFSIIADVVFLLILIRQEEMDLLKLKIKELEHAWDLEKAYYEDLKEKERAVSKVRHDIKNQIAVMYRLLEVGDVQKAKEMQQQLVQQV